MLPSQNRSYLAYHWAGVLVMLICSLCIACFAQSTTSTSPATGTSDNDTDPTRPVFMSIRQEYYDFIGDYWGMATVYRTDKAVLKNRRLGGKSGILLRTDIPLVQVSSGATTKVGIGDIYAQALFIPHIRKTFALATGVGLLTPTATDKALGGGKWKLAPLVLPVWFFGPKAFALVKLQDTFSFAGQSSRPEVHFFQVTPALYCRLSRRWWLVADTDYKVNWERDNAASFKSGLQVGRMLNPRFGLALKPEVNWGGNRDGSWSLKLIMIWVRLT